MPSNCGAGKDSWKFLGQRGNQSILREINPEYYTGKTDANAEAPIF